MSGFSIPPYYNLKIFIIYFSERYKLWDRKL
nr:MAG TPA: hypothetical protein [Bacteriophage sp.]